MSLGPGSRCHSPAISSGRSSPQPRRRLDEDPTKKDPKYKRFSASIDRALALFESNNLQEWADYISFLGRLLKALQSHPSLPLIPSKSLVAQRLAQCLNPRLPSGVHQKTIEVYSYIFSLIGRDGLSSDLALWTPGLTPVLSYASLTLKPHYLDLLERFYLPIGTALRPTLKALVLALLPGIDEEGGEYFDKTLALIDAIRKEVKDDAYFWQCVLLATITAPARRQGALAFLGRRIPKLDGKAKGGGDGDGNAEEERKADADALISPEPGLLVRAFCAGLGDEQLLVQRGFLDLLVTEIPLSSPVLQKKVSKADLQLLVISAAGVVMRRDMSLNRRLWAWFLGPEEANSHGYFRDFGLEALVNGLLQMLDWPNATPAERARPYRICLSLMDHWEVGSLVAPKLFLPAIESLRAFERSAPSKEAYHEAFRSASMFFDGIEAGLIWGQMLGKINTAFSEDGNSAIDHLQTVRFIIRTFNVREEEMLRVHAPMVVLAVLRFLSAGSIGDGESARELWRNGFLLAEEIWELIPATKIKSSATLSPSDDNAGQSVLESIQRFYKRDQVRSTDNSTSTAPFPPFQPPQVADWVFKGAASAVQKALEGNSRDVDIRCRLFVNVIRKVPKLSDWPDAGSLVSGFLSKLKLDPVPFGALRGIANMISAMYSKGYLDTRDTDSLVASVTSRLWYYLSPDAPKFHVESVKGLWNMQNVLGDRRVEAAIATVMTSPDAHGAEPGRNFAVLWNHSVSGIGGSAHHMMLTRPLFLFMDSLADDGSEMSVFARGWLQTLPSINKLFWIFVEKLLGCQFLRDPGERDGDGAPRKRPLFVEDDCLEIATYYFQVLLNVLRYATNNMMAQLATELVVNGDESKAKAFAQSGYGSEDMALQEFFAKVALRAIDGDAGDLQSTERVSKLHKMALGVLHQLLLSPYSRALADMELEDILTARLLSLMETKETYVQVSMLDVLHEALKLSLNRPTSHLGHLRQLSRILQIKTGPRNAAAPADTEKQAPLPQFIPPHQLIKCLIGGFSNTSSRAVLDSWIFFLGECLPLISDVIFQMLIPLVECLCDQIKTTFESLKTVFRETGRINVPESGGKSPESTLVALLNGLEQILAAAHDRLLTEELKSAGPKSPDAPSAGFFGNMVSGVFSVESPLSRSAAANNRLTVLLCFRDTVKICYSIWSWGDISSNGGTLDALSRESWQYTSLRMKGRARRILEHMFAAETLECLETLIELWPGRVAPLGERNVGSIFRLVNVLDGSRPKHTIPAIFNAVYSRTNPSALDPNRRSTLTAELGDVDVVVFLVEYARSLEDDAMDEIWADCMVFLRDVLANPFPHRQILPSLLSFTAILGEKVDNTNFGEQKKMRKELGDLFLRMLTVVFTVAPAGSRSLELPAPIPLSNLEKAEADGEPRPDRTSKGKTAPDDIVPILVSIVPILRKVLLEPERVITASVSISTSLIGPIFRSRSFPNNVSPTLLDLVYQLTRLQNNQKAWKKEVSDAFLDPKFFLSPPSIIKEKWVPLTVQYLLADRERMMELLSRITPPTTAGVLFGVGAASARQEADRRTALNLKRIAFLIFAAEHDAFVPKLTEIEEKLVELLSATAVSSPSSATRGEVYIVLRALALKTSSVHMSSLWPLINTELHNALVALAPDGDPEHTFNDAGILQACKLLDTLLVLSPDEFQLHEWLFVTDTIEAVYHAHDWNPMALADQVVLELSGGRGAYESDTAMAYGAGRKPWFRGRRAGTGQAEMDVKRDVIAPFLRGLSIATYEGTYAMAKPDIEECREPLFADLFEEVPTSA